MKVRYIDLESQFKLIEEKVLDKVASVLRSGNYILGSELSTFEKNIKNYCGSKFALGLANGTDALYLAVKSLDINPGGEIITVPNSFIATVGAIVAAGAKPVFVDVDDDYNINPDLIESAITQYTRAIMPVHLTGRPSNMQRIIEIANKYNLRVIEDAAQAIGARYNNIHVGNCGDVGCFSLHPLKTLNACGDGGFILTNEEEIYEKIRKLRNHGLKNRDEVEFFGVNSRLDELQAAILNVKLNYVDIWNARRREIASFYRKELSDVVTLPVRDERDPVYHTFIIRVSNREALQKHLLERGIEAKVHYPIPLHLQEAARYLGYKKGDFPNTERQAREILSLPIHTDLNDEQIKHVIYSIKDFYIRS